MKLLTLFLAFAPCFIILSICAEGLFYVSYCAALYVWVEVECVLRPVKASAEGKDSFKKETVDSVYQPRTDDIRIALFFLFFVQIAFFGTGK